MKRIIIIFSILVFPFICFGQDDKDLEMDNSLVTKSGGSVLGETKPPGNPPKESPGGFVNDDIFVHLHTEYKKPIPYSPLRQADVIYSKRVWQVIDFREKMNQPFYFPLNEQEYWKSLYLVLKNAIMADKLVAYDGEKGEDFSTTISSKKLKVFLKGSAKAVEQFDPDTGNSLGYVDTYPDSVKSTDVIKLRIKEVWYFDKQRSELQVRILGLCPVSVKTTAVGVSTKALFWVYFPYARPFLAQAEVFNTKNGAERRTYDDIFWKRMFSSYIYKEENVYDRQINQYSVGMDALLESERIKNDVFEIEQNMWEY